MLPGLTTLQQPLQMEQLLLASSPALKLHVGLETWPLQGATHAFGSRMRTSW